jgi:small subunit ribosomal protein S6
MAKQKLRKYELIYLIQPEASDEDREKVHTRVRNVLTEADAKLLKFEEWGKRKLAYEIQKQGKAYYFYLIYVTGPDTNLEIERVLRMLDACVRFQVIRLEDGLDPDATYDVVSNEPAPEETPTETKEEATNG